MKARKSIYKHSFQVATVLMMTFSTVVPAFAKENNGKEEVVYAMLSADGTINDMYVVNIFDEKGNIIDYGEYSAVRNMTTNDEIKMDGTKVTVNNGEDKLYYEGTLKEKSLPWNIKIQYFLDDKEYSADELAGKTGALTIKMKIDENKEINSVFYKNYAVQATVVLDTTKAKKIDAKDATIANVGKNKQLTYTILPDKGADITIKADVEDFEMDEIAINGVNLNLDIEIDDETLMKKVEEIANGVDKIDTGANQVKDGASELNEGTDKLDAGAKELENGSVSLDEGVASLKEGIDLMDGALHELQAQSDSLTGGSAQIDAALREIQDRLADVSVNTDQTQELIDASGQINNGIQELSSSLEQLQNGTGYDQYKIAMSENGIDIDALQAGNSSAIDSLAIQIEALTSSYNEIKNAPEYEEQASQLLAQIESLQSVITLLTGNNAALNGSEAYLSTISESISQIHEGASALSGHYQEFDDTIATLARTLNEVITNISTLSDGINTLVNKYSELDNGINEYTSGVSRIVAGYQNLVDGVASLQTGSQSIKNGTSVLYQNMSALLEGTSELSDGSKDLAEGTNEFKERTSTIDSEVQNEIDDILLELTGEDTEVISFASDKNEDVKAVQFVIKTDDIKKEEENEPQKSPEIELTFWKKFLDLFGL